MKFFRFMLETYKAARLRALALEATLGKLPPQPAAGEINSTLRVRANILEQMKSDPALEPDIRREVAEAEANPFCDGGLVQLAVMKSLNYWLCVNGYEVFSPISQSIVAEVSRDTRAAWVAERRSRFSGLFGRGLGWG